MIKTKFLFIPALLLVPFAFIACGNDDDSNDEAGIETPASNETPAGDGDSGSGAAETPAGEPSASDGSVPEGEPDDEPTQPVDLQGETYDFEGAEETETGLRYIDEVVGDGDAPTMESEVEIHYQGMFEDGTLFDSSIIRGQPEQVPVSGVIPGFAEALLGMQEGGERVIHVPSELAYGERGYPEANIPPNTDVVFEIELIDVR